MSEEGQGWMVKLPDHIARILNERDARYAERFAAQDAALTQARSAARALWEESDRRYEQQFHAVQQVHDGADRRYEQRFIAQEVAVQSALTAQEKAVNAALIAADRAVIKAETSADKRFDAVNEFRQTLADQTAEFPRKSEVDVELRALAKRLDDMGERMNRAEQGRVGTIERRAGSDASWHSVAVVLGLFLSVSAVIVAVVFGVTR